ncbi:MAG: amidohydrolase family protein [Eubacteriales bacterium]|nr:amidohydrolase family protein [Clostridiales bacterium]MDY5836999.1 amidohydrolase family protein [Eubacteriales bacterium]
MYDILLLHGLVITMDEDRRIIEDGAVAIKDNRIKLVGSSQELSQLPAKKVIDCTDHVIMPGFIDTHGHGGHSMFKAIVKDTSYWMPVMTHVYKNYVTDNFWYIEGRLSALERLQSGVTTGVCVLGSQPRCDDPIFAINNAKAYAEIGVRDVVCTGPCSLPWPHRFSRWKDGKRSRVEVSFEQILDSLEVIIQELDHANNDKTRAFVAPFGVVTSIEVSGPTGADRVIKPTEWDLYQAKAMRQIAAKYNTRIHTDAFGGMVRLASMDKENALLGPDVHLQHCTGLSVDEILILQQTDTHVSFAPGIRQIYNRTPVAELLELGVTVALSTDGSMLSSSFNMFSAMKRAQTIYRAAVNDYYYLPSEKILEMVTIDAARCLGMEQEIGSISEGKKADIISIDIMNPRYIPRVNLVDAIVLNGAPGDIDLVIIDGKIHMEDHQVLNIDEHEIYRQVEEEAASTIERAGLDKFAFPSQSQWGRSKYYPDEVRFDLEQSRKDGNYY